MTRTYSWRSDGEDHELRLVQVPGTNGTPYLFGREPRRKPVDVSPLFIAATPVTQALWSHVMSANPACRQAPRSPVENVSWNDITGPDGFLARLNDSDILSRVADADASLRFRLPSETEWEYAARGGPRWRDALVYSGSNDPDEVAWYGPRWTSGHDLLPWLFGWRLGWRIACRLPHRRFATRTHDVASKAANQLGLHDMSGNVWEWCQDVCVDDFDAVPTDGTPYVGEGTERRLRGGCHHNWNLHCSVSWRYGITPDAHDGCIGFRLVLG